MRLRVVGTTAAKLGLPQPDTRGQRSHYVPLFMLVLLARDVQWQHAFCFFTEPFIVFELLYMQIMTVEVVVLPLSVIAVKWNRCELLLQEKAGQACGSG